MNQIMIIRMMNNMNGFSYTRLVSELRRTVVGQRRTMLISVLVIVLVVIVPAYYTQYFLLRSTVNQMLVYGNLQTSESTDYAMMISVPAAEIAIFTVALFVLGIVAASLMFGQLGSKSGRCEDLMIPASAAEKYAARWLVYVPGFLIVFLVAAVLTDLTRPLVFSFVAPRDVNLYTSLRYFEQYRSDLGEDVLRLSSLYLFLISLFTLGSIVWPRNSLLKTFSLIVALALIAIVWFLIWSGTFVSDADPMPDIVGRYFDPILIVLAVFNWIVAYVRLTETDLLPHTGPYNRTNNK